MCNGKEQTVEVNRQQPRSVRLRPIRKIPAPITLLISTLPEMINQTCKKYSLDLISQKTVSCLVIGTAQQIDTKLMHPFEKFSQTVWVKFYSMKDLSFLTHEQLKSLVWGLL